MPDNNIGLSAMGATLAERKAFREAQEAESVESEGKAVEPEGAENKAVPKKRVSKK